MASTASMACHSLAVDSGVDSEATTPSSPEDEALEESEKKLSNDEMVLETAETLLALSGKKPSAASLAASSQNETEAVVLPQPQPQEDAKGTLFLCFYDVVSNLELS